MDKTTEIINGKLMKLFEEIQYCENIKKYFEGKEKTACHYAY